MALGNLKDSIDTFYNSIQKNDEFEISFLSKPNKLNLEKHITMLKFFTSKKDSNTTEISRYLTVAFNYNYDNFSAYRINISGVENINKVINDLGQRENHIIFSSLYSKYSSGKFNYITGIEKQKNKDNMFVSEELGIKLRKSTELDLDKSLNINLTHTDRNYIGYIERASLIIEDTKDYIIRVDLSYVHSSKTLHDIIKKNGLIELEIDLTLKNNVNEATKNKLYTSLTNTYVMIAKVLQKSNILLQPNEKKSILNNFLNLLFPEQQIEIKDLPAMQSQSAEIIHIVDYINHDYCVTDKADGERHFLYVFDGRQVVISNTLEIKEIDHIAGLEEFNDSIFDGEYIFIDKAQKFSMLLFDCLMFKKSDIRNDKILDNRLSCCTSFTTTIYKQKNIFKKYTGELNINKMTKFYMDSIKKWIDELNSMLQGKFTNIVITKFFAFPQGIELWEIFFLTNLIWKAYKSNSIDYPYHLDGCMLTPIEQIYTRSSRDTTHKIYKVKPGVFNSIDMYIEFERDKLSGALIDVFDDSEPVTSLTDQTDNSDIVPVNKSRLYRIAYLHVGKIINGSEIPVLFHEDVDQHYVYLPIVDGEVRDIEGNIIQDKTVVEFTYKNDLLIKPGYRWIPLRTRYDKTESVNLYKRKYGNNNETAEKIWNSITDGIEMSDIELLGNPNTYKDHNALLKSKITSSTIERERRDNAYYNLINEIGNGLRKIKFDCFILFTKRYSW